MDGSQLLLAALLPLALNLGLWRLSRGYTRVAGAAMFVLSLSIASPLIGVGVWTLARANIETSLAGSDGDALIAIGAALLNATLALLGAIAASLRKPIGKDPGKPVRVRLRSD